jgi:hypothetical protein
MVLASRKSRIVHPSIGGEQEDQCPRLLTRSPSFAIGKDVKDFIWMHSP